MIHIVLKSAGVKFMECGYLWLDPSAPNTGRKFVFSEISKEDIINNGSVVNVDISFVNREGKLSHYFDFDICVLSNGQNRITGECWVYGTLQTEEGVEYKQGIIDVFKAWQNGIPVDWHSFDNSNQKSEYISACMRYSGLSTKMREKHIYQFDFSLINEVCDFCYLGSLEFVGERGYFGHDFHTFEDCLIEIFHHQGSFEGKKIKFLEVDKIKTLQSQAIFDEAMQLFTKYNFDIV